MDDIPLYFTARSEKDISIRVYNETSRDNEAFRKMSHNGYTCQKFTIKTKVK